MPEQWQNTKKTSILTKQTVAPLQANEVANIRRKSADFDVRQHKFRETFRKIPPFFYTCEEPYGYLDEVSDPVLVPAYVTQNNKISPNHVSVSFLVIFGLI